MHGIQMENNEKMHVNEKMHAKRKKCTVFKIALSLKLTLSVPVLLSLSVPVLSFSFSGLLSTFYIWRHERRSVTRAPHSGSLPNRHL